MKVNTLSYVNLNREDVEKLLKGVCKNPSVDCTNLLTLFTGSIHVSVYLSSFNILQILLLTWNSQMPQARIAA